MNVKRLPPRSPYSLIQEDVYPNRWLTLVVCMMLNCTSRKQVEKVLPEFVKRWPDPQVFLAANKNDVIEVCRSLGFANRRTDNLFKMTERFLTSDWSDPRDLPGVGDYAARSYEIFCLGQLGEECPQDHALTQYFLWRKQQDEDAT